MTKLKIQGWDGFTFTLLLIGIQKLLVTTPLKQGFGLVRGFEHGCKCRFPQGILDHKESQNLSLTMAANPLPGPL